MENCRVLSPSFEEQVKALQLSAEWQVVHLFADPADGILKQQEELKPALIIMAAHSHTMMGRLFLGSNTDMVLHQSSSPIFVYKQTERDPQQIIVPLDFSSISEQLLRKADEIALSRQGEAALAARDGLPRGACRRWRRFLRSSD